MPRGGVDRCGDAATGEDVVFLDQKGVVQADAVVVAAAAADRVFLCQTQAGNGLARIQQFHPRAGHLAGVAGGEGGGAGEGLQKIQRRALAGEQGAGGALKGKKDLIRLDLFTITYLPLEADAAVHLAEHLIHPGAAADGGRFSTDDPATGTVVGRNQGRRDIATADILGQGGAHVLFDDGFQITQVQHGGLVRPDFRAAILAKALPGGTVAAGAGGAAIRLRQWGVQ